MNKVSFPYRCLRELVRLVTDGMYYSNVKVIGLENVPAPGTPAIIASNHFNSLNDALAILLSLNDRKPGFIVRADVFENPFADKFLRSIGLLPAYRLDFDGAGSMSSNSSTFLSSEKALVDGGTVVLFPQAGHSAGYWIDRFTGGMAKMVFEAAASTDFEKEILIVPACNYYRDVTELRSDMLVKYSEPVKASQFYDLYKTKPHTAIRSLNDLIMSKIKPMMLDITDREHYDEVRFILDSGFVPGFALSCGIDNSDIEGNLNVCKRIAEGLNSALRKEDEFFPSVASQRGQSADDLKKEAARVRAASMEKAGVTSVEKGPVASMFDKAAQLMAEEKALGIDDAQFDRKPGMTMTLVRAAVAMILLPVAIFCLWPALFCWLVPELFSRRMKDKLFRGTFFIALNVVLVLPLAAIITLIFAGLSHGIILALIYTALLPVLFIIECHYVKFLLQTAKDFKWISASRKGRTGNAEKMRSDLFSELEDILR